MKQQYQAKVIPVTPEMAKRWGERNNNHNRPLYYSVADVYARDMKNGLWKVNNQGIGFDWFGNLIDGQHRLMAIVISGNVNGRDKVYQKWSFKSIPLLEG